MLRAGLLAPALLAPAPALGVASPPERRYSAFHPGQPWTDTSGATIDAHGAGLLTVGTTTYWYGSQRQGHPATAPRGTYPPYSAFCHPPPAPDGSQRRRLDGFTLGVNLYVSDGDLYNWRHHGLVFDANVTGANCLERPKVVQCPATGKFVLWAKGDDNAGTVHPPKPDNKLAVVAVADTPLGPFRLADPQRPLYSPASCKLADATLHVSGGEVWLYWRSPTPCAAKRQGPPGSGGFW